MFENKDEGTIWDRENRKQQTNLTEPDDLFEEPKKSGGITFFLVCIAILGIISAVSWLYMATQGTGLYMAVSPSDWAVLQSPTGEVTVIDEVGIHFRGLSNYWIYPRYVSKTPKMISATFSEGKSRGVKTMYRVELPTGEKERINFHIWSGAKHTVVEDIMDMWITNCVKVAAPTMTGDEVWNDPTKRREYSRLVTRQIENGLYRYNKVDSEAGMTFEVALVDGKPVIVMTPPFKQYGLTLTQVAIIEMRLPDYESAELEKERVARTLIKEKLMEIEYYKQEKALLEAKQAAKIPED
jgi:hypothetical protein